MIGQGDHAYTVPFYGERRQQLLDLLDKDDKEITSKYQYVQRKGDTLYAETLAPALHGGKGAYVWAVVGPIFDVNGNRIGAIESIRDITERKREQEELQNSLRFLETMINTIPSPIFFKDRQGHYLGCNDTFARQIVGLPREGIVGKSVYELPEAIPSDLADGYYKQDQELLRESGIQVYETQTQCADGLRRDFLFSKATFNNFVGEVAGIVGVMLDITERKRAEDALQEAKQAAEYRKAQYEQAVSMISDIVWRYDVNAQGKNISTYISPVADRLLGLPDGTIGNSFDKYFSYVHPDDLPAVQKALLEGIQTLGKDKTAEYRLRKADGTTLWVRSKGSAHLQDDGQIIVFGTTSDITDLKQAEEELERTQSSMKIAMDLVKVVRWEYDVETDMFTFDDQFYTLYGTTADREGGPLMSSQDYAQKFIPPEEAPLVAEEIGKSLATTDPNFTSQVEHRIIRADGTEGVIAVRYAIVKDDKGRTIKTYGANQDITKRKRVEEALRKAHDELEIRVKERTEELARKNAEMERFIYTVSHDLRTPLISMSGFLGFIDQDAQKGDLERMKADLKIVSDSVSHMDRLLQSTLELSRIGRVISPPEDVPFRDIARDAFSQIDEKIKHMGVAVSIAPDMSIVHVDKMRITEALVNLVENSIKYAGTQEKPEIEIGQRIEGKKRIFFVRDNGMGIDPSQHDNVFELFYKIDKKSQGSGAGLAIVKRIIEVHGGRIWIESELGKGCTVCFTLPPANVG